MSRSSFHTLNKRLDKLLAQVSAPTKQAEPFNRSLFTREELAEIDILFEQVAPRVQIGNDKRQNFELLTDHELEQLERWLLLEEARKAETRIGTSLFV